MRPPASLERLARALHRLPVVGRRGADRMALAIALDSGDLVNELITSLDEVRQSLGRCERCGGLTAIDQNPCALCTDPRRESRLLCVVEMPGDILLIERCGEYRGRYHALLGKLAPARGEEIPRDRMDALLRRIREEGVEEVILALNADVESDATAALIRHRLERLPVRVTRPARGIPAGTELALADPLTLAKALQGRRPM